MKKYTVSKRNILILSGIILLHIIWFGAGMYWRHFYNGDSYEYIYLAENIKHGYYYGANAVLPIIDYRLSARPPVYSLLLLAFYTLFGYSTWPILLFQNVLSIISCLLILDIFKKVGAGKKYGWIYFLFLACYPAQMFFSTLLAPDIVLQFFLMLYFRHLLLSLYTIDSKHIGYMSLWLTLATLTKPIVYPFLFLHLLFSIWYLFRSTSKIVLLTGALPIMIMLGYGLWNLQRTGMFHVSSIQSNNLLYYNAGSYLSSKYGTAYADSLMGSKKKEMATLHGLKSKYEYASHQATAIIKANIWSYGLFHLKESIRYFVEPGKSELDLYTGYLGYYFDPNAANFYKKYKENGIAGAWDYLRSYPWLPLILLVFLFNLLRLFGWFLFIINKKIPLPLKVFSAIYILYFAAITGPVANTRYFLPVLLILSALSAIGYADWIARWKTRKQP